MPILAFGSEIMILSEKDTNNFYRSKYMPLKWFSGLDTPIALVSKA